MFNIVRFSNPFTEVATLFKIYFQLELSIPVHLHSLALAMIIGSSSPSMTKTFDRLIIDDPVCVIQ